MASISSNKKNQRRRLLFQDLNGERKEISLGKISMRQASTIQLHVEELLLSRQTGRSPPAATTAWLSDISDNKRLLQLLIKHGLVDAACGRSKAVTLGAFVDAYITEFGPTVKKNTVITWNQCRRLLLEKFAPDLRLDRFTVGDAIRFRNHLLTRGNSRTKSDGTTRKNLAETTVRKRCACAKQFFAYAVAEEIISNNPFDTKKIPTNSFKVRDKEFVDRDLSLSPGALNKATNGRFKQGHFA